MIFIACKAILDDLMHVTQGVTGGVLWANAHLLFWLSLVPFVTAWMAENRFGHRRRPEGDALAAGLRDWHPLGLHPSCDSQARSTWPSR